MTDILALSGSLRAASYNTALLRACALLAPAGLRISLCDGMGDLPLFNPDLDDDPPPAARRLRERATRADVVMIASPEYAHGVTAVIKNALDWLVGCEAFVDKPVVVLNASPRSLHADPALRETVRMMSARIVEEASVTIPVQGSRLDAQGMAGDAAIAAAIRAMLEALRRNIPAAAAASPPPR